MDNKNLIILIVIIIVIIFVVGIVMYSNSLNNPVRDNTVENLTVNKTNTSIEKGVSEKSNSQNSNNDPIVGYLSDGTPIHKSEYNEYYDKEPVYNFNPSDPAQMKEMEDKMNEEEGKIEQ